MDQLVTTTINYFKNFSGYLLQFLLTRSIVRIVLMLASV